MSSLDDILWRVFELLIVQILVAVASIQKSFLKTDEEKGSMRTEIDHGLFDPKERGGQLYSPSGNFWKGKG